MREIQVSRMSIFRSSLEVVVPIYHRDKQKCQTVFINLLLCYVTKGHAVYIVELPEYWYRLNRKQCVRISLWPVLTQYCRICLSD